LHPQRRIAHPGSVSNTAASASARHAGPRPFTAATRGYFAAFIGMGLVNASLGPTLPGLAAQTGSSLGALGVLISARSLGYLVALHPAGLGFDRRPGHAWLGVALLCIAGGMALTPGLPSVWALLPIMLGVGAGEAVLDLAGNTLLAWAHGARAAAYLNALHFFYGVGALLAPLVVAASLTLGGGIAGAYWTLAALLLPVALGVLATRPPAAPARRAAAGAAADARADGLLVLLLAALLLLAVGAEVSLGGWWASYALRVGLTDAAGAAVLTSLYWSGFAAGRLVGVALSTRWLPRRVLVLHLGIALLAVGAAAAWPWLAWAAAPVAGWGIGPLFATAVAFAGRRIPLSGRVTSRLFMGGALGGMTLPWLAGLLLARAGALALMLWIAALLALALVVVWRVVSQDGRRRPPLHP
jgi:FHS family Na+ dependent glucose MFS transporter 1